MKYKPFRFLFFGVLCCIFSSCSDIQPNFIINNQDLAISITKPELPYDSTSVLTINAGDTIIITDVSTPFNSIKSRIWDIDGDGIWDTSFNDSDHFATAYPNEGLYSITFCVNGEKNCITKWVNVEGGEEIYSPDFDVPELKFLKPMDFISDSDARNIEIEVETKNIYFKDELTLTVGGKDQDFDFDETAGLLSAKKIRLSSGENKIEVIANTVDGVGSSFVIVTYKKGGNGITSSLPDKGRSEGSTQPERAPPPPPPIPKPNIVINDIKENEKIFNTKQIEVKITTENASKNNIVFTLNGVQLRNVVRTRNYGDLKENSDWVVSLNLEEGKSNLFKVEASNSSGGKSIIKTLIYKDLSKPLPSLGRGSAGPKASGLSESCMNLYNKESFKVILKTKANGIALEQFFIYTSSCGRVKVSIVGPGLSDSFYSAVNGPQSQIVFEDNPILDPNSTYTLTVKAMTGGGCQLTEPPLFKNAINCPASVHDSKFLEIDQPDGIFIFDLKF